jgi:hypothetical protein
MDYDATYGAVFGRAGGRVDGPERPNRDAESRETTSFQVPTHLAPPVGARMMLVVFHHPVTDVSYLDVVPSETGHWIVTAAEKLTTPGGAGIVTVYLSVSKLAG